MSFRSEKDTKSEISMLGMIVVWSTTIHVTNGFREETIGGGEFFYDNWNATT